MGRLRGIRGRRMSLVVSCPVNLFSWKKGIKGWAFADGIV